MALERYTDDALSRRSAQGEFFIGALALYVPYAIGCWLFFVLTAFHAALLRSQEEMHISSAVQA
jgi:hypothetical protein